MANPKNSRQWAQLAEQGVTAAINGPTDDPHAQLVADRIKGHVPGIVSAEWKGAKDYANGGDIVLVLEDGTKRPCECKFSKKSGSGTLKNMTGDTLNKDIDPSIKGYPEFDLPYKKKRYELFEYYEGRQPQTAKEYQAKLRGWKTTDRARLDEIRDITTPGQEAYALYAASELNQYLDRVNDFVNKILSTKFDFVNKILRQDVLFCVTKNWQDKSQSTEFYDFLNMDRKVTQVVAKGKTIKFQNGKGKDVITMSVNWKNICQGGQTPSFNVFIGNEFSHNDHND